MHYIEYMNKILVFIIVNYVFLKCPNFNLLFVPDERLMASLPRPISSKLSTSLASVRGDG